MVLLYGSLVGAEQPALHETGYAVYAGQGHVSLHTRTGDTERPVQVVLPHGGGIHPSPPTRPTDARDRGRHGEGRDVGVVSEHRRVPRVALSPSPRALVPAERRAVRDTLHSARFVDQSPAEVYATLLEEQTYLCSPRTMYRVLAEADEVRERRDQVRHPAYVKPELVATAPNQVWSWDITKLKGPVPYLYYSLYVILDLFSRYVVGWMVAVKESAHLAERLIEQTCAKQRIQPQQLTIHADRGAPMRSKLVALLFSDLGIAASHSRPRVSNDNPFSAAQFRTFKYRPEPYRDLRRLDLLNQATLACS